MGLTALMTTHLFAQIDPVARARQLEAEDQQQRMNARLQALEEALQTIQQEMGALRAEMRNMRDTTSRANPATQSSLTQLEEKIREVDRKRITDQEKVLSLLGRIEKQASGPTSTRPPKDKVEKETKTAPPPGKTYEYTIREGDSLYKIVRDLREQKVNVTEAAIKQANPKTDWNNLKIGKTINIPVPDK